MNQGWQACSAASNICFVTQQHHRREYKLVQMDKSLGPCTPITARRRLPSATASTCQHDAGNWYTNPSASPCSSSPFSFSTAGSTPKKGRVADPGFRGVAPGRGVIRWEPVSVCHQVSTMGHLLSPTTCTAQTQVITLGIASAYASSGVGPTCARPESIYWLAMMLEHVIAASCVQVLLRRSEATY